MNTRLLAPNIDAIRQCDLNQLIQYRDANKKRKNPQFPLGFAVLLANLNANITSVAGREEDVNKIADKILDALPDDITSADVKTIKKIEVIYDLVQQSKGNVNQRSLKGLGGLADAAIYQLLNSLSSKVMDIYFKDKDQLSGLLQILEEAKKIEAAKKDDNAVYQLERVITTIKTWGNDFNTFSMDSIMDVLGKLTQLNQISNNDVIGLAISALGGAGNMREKAVIDIVLKSEDKKSILFKILLAAKNENAKKDNIFQIKLDKVIKKMDELPDITLGDFEKQYLEPLMNEHMLMNSGFLLIARQMCRHESMKTATMQDITIKSSPIVAQNPRPRIAVVDVDALLKHDGSFNRRFAEELKKYDEVVIVNEQSVEKRMANLDANDPIPQFVTTAHFLNGLKAYGVNHAKVLSISETSSEHHVSALPASIENAEELAFQQGLSLWKGKGSINHAVINQERGDEQAASVSPGDKIKPYQFLYPYYQSQYTETNTKPEFFIFGQDKEKLRQIMASTDRDEKNKPMACLVCDNHIEPLSANVAAEMDMRPYEFRDAMTKVFAAFFKSINDFPLANEMNKVGPIEKNLIALMRIRKKLAGELPDIAESLTQFAIEQVALDKEVTIYDYFNLQSIKLFMQDKSMEAAKKGDNQSEERYDALAKELEGPLKVFSHQVLRLKAIEIGITKENEIEQFSKKHKMFDEIKNTMLMETLVKTISLEKIEDHVKKLFPTQESRDVFNKAFFEYKMLHAYEIWNSQIDLKVPGLEGKIKEYAASWIPKEKVRETAIRYFPNQVFAATHNFIFNFIKDIKHFIEATQWKATGILDGERIELSDKSKKRVPSKIAKVYKAIGKAEKEGHHLQQHFDEIIKIGIKESNTKQRFTLFGLNKKKEDPQMQQFFDLFHKVAAEREKIMTTTTPKLS